MRFIIRLIGVVLFAAAFVVLVIDGTRSIAGDALFLTSLADSMRLLWPTSVDTLQAMLGAVWNPAGAWLFAQPAFAVLGILGLLLMLMGRSPAHVVRPLPRRY